MKDRDRFERLAASASASARHERNAQTALANLRGLSRQAEVEAAKLQGDPVWDAFVQLLQAEANAYREAAERHERIVLRNGPEDVAERERSRIEAIAFRRMAEVLERVTGVPKALRESAQRAREVLRGDAA